MTDSKTPADTSTVSLSPIMGRAKHRLTLNFS